MHTGFSWVKPEGDYLKELGVNGTIIVSVWTVFILLRMCQ